MKNAAAAPPVRDTIRITPDSLVAHSCAAHTVRARTLNRELVSVRDRRD